MPNNSVRDYHKSGSTDIRDPVRNLKAIDFSADVLLDAVTTVLKIETAGTLTVDMVDVGTAITLALAVGYHPLRISKIYTAGSATLTGFYGW